MRLALLGLMIAFTLSQGCGTGWEQNAERLEVNDNLRTLCFPLFEAWGRPANDAELQLALTLTEEQRIDGSLSGFVLWSSTIETCYSASATDYGTCINCLGTILCQVYDYENRGLSSASCPMPAE